MEGLLKRDGLELLKARSGNEALELLLLHEVALAFIDVRMPGMDGFELAELMRGTERTRGVPIIFLTAGDVDQQRRIRGYETGTVDFLPKPIDPGNLLTKSATFFELARQREELLRSEARLRAVNEELAQRNAELALAAHNKDEFLAMLAHELRNPLAPLRNATEILQMPAATAAHREQALSVLRRQIRNMGHMLDDLLDVSRITQGKIKLKRETVDLRGLLKAAADASRPECEAMGQELVLELPEEPLPVWGDATRLEQIVSNLLGNACKYSGRNSRVSLRAELGGEQHPGQANIRVIDNGNGIPPEVLPRIFDLFVQGDRTLDRSHGGLGIGLTVAHRLVALHGGTIAVHSDGVGHGSEFTVRLPLAKPAPAAEASTASRPAPPRTFRMLIVDDNRDAAESLEMLQIMNGHEVRVSHDGIQAVASARTFRPEVVILDIGLPKMDGFEVARRLRAMPGLEKIFIIALTGYGSESDRLLARQAGINEHLVKPADPGQLGRLLEKVP